MSKSILKGLMVCLLVALLMTVASIPVLAFDGRGGDTVTIGRGEVIEGDLYLAGRNLIVDGTVNGDVFAAGQTITINGTVNGGISLAGQTVMVKGKITHGARLAGQSINVGGSIGRDLVVAGAIVYVSSSVTVSGDLIFGVQSARIDGRINGSIKGSANEVFITDEVGGNIELRVDRLTVTSTANIKGNLTYTSENEAVIQSGAQVVGKTTHHLPEVKAPARAAPFFGVVGKVLGFLMILVIGIIIILIASRRTMLMAASIRAKPWQSLGWGALILFATPIAAIIVLITIIGLPVGLIGLVLYGIAIYLSQVPVAVLIGQLIITRDREIESRGLMVGALALGLVILLLLGLIPFVGGFIGLLVVIFGLGSLVTSIKRLPAEAE